MKLKPCSHDYILAHVCQSLKFVLLQLFLNSQRSLCLQPSGEVCNVMYNYAPSEISYYRTKQVIFSTMTGIAS